MRDELSVLVAVERSTRNAMAQAKRLGALESLRTKRQCRNQTVAPLPPTLKPIPTDFRYPKQFSMSAMACYQHFTQRPETLHLETMDLIGILRGLFPQNLLDAV